MAEEWCGGVRGRFSAIPCPLSWASPSLPRFYTHKYSTAFDCQADDVDTRGVFVCNEHYTIEQDSFRYQRTLHNTSWNMFVR